MNRKHIVFSVTLLLGAVVLAQETKTYKEIFNVGEGTVLEINTSHTDIEFETWDKNQVEIVATVTLDDATKEEAEDYFEKDPFKIVGNSREIEISSVGRNSWNFSSFNSDFDFDVEPLFLDLEIPDLPELAVIPELAVMPPLPPMNFKNFDYDQYREEGMEYLKEWAEGFEEGFDEEYQERMKEWGKRVEERAKAWEERNAERLKERERLMEERAKEMEKRAADRAKRVEERAKEMEERRKARGEDPQRVFFSSDDYDGPNIFYFSSDGENKKYKVKKTIKIKMPKSVKLKMNVKHGEVKLAVTTENINASLRYASLLASTIDGRNTKILASYSPVVVQKWNLGSLKADYSDNISLKEVGEVQLNAVSSNITIDRLRNKAFVTNSLGKLAINNINSDFSDVDVNVQNGEVFCKIPSTPVSFYLNGTKSKIAYPSNFIMEQNVNFDNVIHKGFRGNDNSGKLITINSKYSEVVLKE